MMEHRNGSGAESEKDFLFSVIIPVYNTEEYLGEAIESIILQTIGFEDHIQLILVNDGSTDNSEAVCLAYQAEFPDNIVYKRKENGGVASACNAGLELATGRYVNFLGSDDMWAPGSLQSVFDLFSVAGEAIDVVSCKMTFFGAASGAHPLNYKYHETDVVDLLEHPEFINLTTGNCFIRRTTIGELKFDERMEYAEDAVFINTILLKKCLHGVVRDAEYHYRKRELSLSSYRTTKNNALRRFTVDEKLFGMRLYKLSRDMYNTVLQFIAYTVMYEMQWRIVEQPTDDITQDAIDEYECILKELLQEVSDETIFAQRSLPTLRRSYVYRLKHGDDFFKNDVEWTHNRAFLGDMRVFNLRERTRLAIKTLEIEGNNLVIRCMTDIDVLNRPFKLYVKRAGGEKIAPQVNHYSIYDIKAFNGTVLRAGNVYMFTIPLREGDSLSFHAKIKGVKAVKLRPSFGMLAKLDHRIGHSYWQKGRYILRYENNCITVNGTNKLKHINAELRLLGDIVSYRNTATSRKQLRNAFFLRLARDVTLPLLRGRKIWLICDRDEHATDNGASFFEYATSHLDDRRIVPYFILSKKSVDYPRLKEFGRIVEPNSLMHHILYLNASKIISAHGDGAITQPFRGQVHFLTNLMNFKYVYLQHGIMQGDLSSWLQITSKNIKLIPVSTKMEMKAILEGDYGYTKREVKMLGAPRFDKLATFETVKKVAFLPTWRSDMAGKIIPGTRVRERIDNFTETDYYEFYDALINDGRLISAMKELGYIGEFYLHPCFAAQAGDFKGNEAIIVHDEEANYTEVLGESALLVTDYSGVQFDFAYQRKPIVYTQFDDIYGEGHHHSYAQTFFDYETMGFGPITRTVDEAVDHIIALLRGGCVLEESYRKRVNKFFYFDDNENTKRVFEAVLNMG